MFDLPLHPMVIHLPIGLSLAVVLLAPVVLIAWKCGYFSRRTWWMIPLLQFVLLVGSVTAVYSGELAEGNARQVVPNAEVIDRHERQAKRFSLIAAITFVLSLTGAAVSDSKRAQHFATAAVVAAVLQMGGCVLVSHTGGMVVWGPEGLVGQDIPP